MHARIFQRPRSTMQSGRARTGQWVLAPERGQAQRPDPLTGWPGSGDTATQVELVFADEAAAVAYAESKGFDYRIERLPPKTLRLQAYADNFR